MKKAVLIFVVSILMQSITAELAAQNQNKLQALSPLVTTSLSIPFSEHWDAENFTHNGWTTESANWIIETVEGNPAPSAQFNWNPIIEEDYSSALTSNWIDATTLTESQLFLDFDIKLDNRVITKTENFWVEVFNDSTWVPIAIFTNNYGSFDWTSYHLNITDHAMARLFQIRFVAQGKNSHYVNAWQIDNIEIYRHCAAPTNLYCSEYGLEDNIIGWNTPIVNPEIAEWMYYDDGYPERVYGSDTEDWAADQVVGFTWNQLYYMEDAAITKISAFVDSRLIGVGTVGVKIWQGAQPDTLIYEEDITSQILIGDDFNEVTLATAVPFDHMQPLWVGIHTSGPAQSYGIGLTHDLGTWDDRADLINRGNGWEHIQDMGLNNRAWLIRAYVTTNFQTKQLSSYHNTKLDFFSGTLQSHNSTKQKLNAPVNRNIMGYNIYRKLDWTDFEMYQFVPSIDSTINQYFVDTDVNHSYSNGYYYQVTCLWESGTDYCESAPGLDVSGYNNYVGIYIPAGIQEEAVAEINLHPNPSSHHVMVTATSPMKKLTLLNPSGQCLFQKTLNGEKSELLSTSGYHPGLYFLQLHTKEGTFIKKLLISR